MTKPRFDHDGPIPRLDLTTDEATELRSLADKLTGAGPVDRRLHTFAVAAHELPARVRAVLTDFRLTGKPYGGLVLSGLPIDETQLGPTPVDDVEPQSVEPQSVEPQSVEPQSVELERATAMLLLVGSLLGSPYSFLTQRAGELVRDVHPMPDQEHKKLASSSTTTLHWHVEDAFHIHQPDWIVLVGLRNPDNVATTHVPVTDLDLPPDIARVLSERLFVILPDESHSPTLDTAANPPSADVFERLVAATYKPRELAVLTGDPAAPFLCVDPPFMQRPLTDPRAEHALDTLIHTVDRSLRDVVVRPGQILIIDNKRAVHGRRPFRPRYDGTDRWLRRIKVTADLRPTEGRRFGHHGRAVV